MDNKILKLLEKNCRTPVDEIALLTGLTEEEVCERIARMEKEGVIRGYKCVIDWERRDRALVSAIIELKVTPKAELGFEEVAERIASYPEVESVSLMSGACDLTVTVRGRTFREISSFVARELASIDSVTSTATQFVMKKYKEFGIELSEPEEDERSRISL